MLRRILPDVGQVAVGIGAITVFVVPSFMMGPEHAFEAIGHLWRDTTLPGGHAAHVLILAFIFLLLGLGVWLTCRGAWRLRCARTGAKRRVRAR